jgi:hypothetical protein
MEWNCPEPACGRLLGDGGLGGRGRDGRFLPGAGRCHGPGERRELVEGIGRSALVGGLSDGPPRNRSVGRAGERARLTKRSVLNRAMDYGEVG